jgi:CBS-domain-containing membrane protein
MSDTALPADATLRDAVALIERSRRLLAPVVDDQGRLIGVLSDGDIRRAMLAGHQLAAPAVAVMTRHPITGPATASPEALLDLMVTRGVAAIPIVDAQGRFVRVLQAHDVDLDSRAWSGGAGYAAAVIMAGGEGRRLRPLTLDRPKPMIDIGGVPLLERQVRAHFSPYVA